MISAFFQNAVTACGGPLSLMRGLSCRFIGEIPTETHHTISETVLISYRLEAVRRSFLLALHFTFVADARGVD
jgi:hypothetical protein